jgi:hypothetical protein
VSVGRGSGAQNAHPTLAQKRGRRHLAAPVLGAPYPRRAGLRGACTVLLDQSGEARFGRTGGGLAVFVNPLRHRARDRGAGVVRRGAGARVRGVGWGGTTPYTCYNCKSTWRKNTDIEQMARLAWIKCYLDEKTGEMKTDFAVSATHFDDETIREFDEIVGYIAEFRPFFLDYMILRENFSEIVHLNNRVQQMIFEESLGSIGVMTIKLHTLCQQKFMNFLFTATSMRDHYKIRIAKLFGKRSNEFKYISKIETELKKQFKSFKICHYLRNYAAHHTLPIDNIPSNFSRRTETEWAGSNSYIIRKSNLLLSRDIKKELLEILDEIPEIIHLPEMIDEYFRINSQIFLKIVDFFRPKISEIIQYREVIIKHKPDMEGARPILFHGDMPNTDEDFKMNFSEFSFEEVEMLLKIVSEIKNHRAITTHPSSAH